MIVMEKTVKPPPGRHITRKTAREVPVDGIDDVRRYLQKEMAEKGTLSVRAAAGDGWEAHARERVS